jgi:hypothetical protein
MPDISDSGVDGSVNAPLTAMLTPHYPRATSPATARQRQCYANVNDHAYDAQKTMGRGHNEVRR